LSEEIKRMQELAGILKEYKSENKSPDLTIEEKGYLENELEKFLNISLFSSEILRRDSEEFEPSLEEQAIQFIIKTLEDRISYYQ